MKKGNKTRKKKKMVNKPIQPSTTEQNSSPKPVSFRKKLGKIISLIFVVFLSISLLIFVYVESRDLLSSISGESTKVLVERIEYHSKAANQAYFEYKGKEYNADCPHWIKEGNYLPVYRDEDRDRFVSEYKYKGWRLIAGPLFSLLVVFWVYWLVKSAIKDFLSDD